MEVTKYNKSMISNMIKLVFEEEITWETLESFLDDMSSTVSKSKQIIKILIHELKALDSKNQKSKIDISPTDIAEENTMETETNSVIEDIEEDIKYRVTQIKICYFKWLCL